MWLVSLAGLGSIIDKALGLEAHEVREKLRRE
jgi:hypothetical protein